MIESLPDLIGPAAARSPDADALHFKSATISYSQLATSIDAFAGGLIRLGLKRYERVAIFAGKQLETVVAIFGSTRASGTFVPINTLFKPAQVSHILRDSNVRFLVTTSPRLKELRTVLENCADLVYIILLDGLPEFSEDLQQEVVPWSELQAADSIPALPRLLASDMAAIFYTSGSTGRPKGVVLSHGNLTTGALSVASYIGNTTDDRILAVLPLSFDAGFSQLSTGLSSGACVILHDYLLPSDIVRIIEKESITGITGVPPLWMQLAEQTWPENAGRSVRYFANTGGKMPIPTLTRLRNTFPQAKPFLMYGLTESFRSTYLPPEQVDEHPDSIGIAIPNAEVMVVAEDGSICAPGVPGELVHRGPLVSLGYWNDPERTAERFRPAPLQPKGIPNPEYAVFSGDTVVSDEDGYLYFVGRRDEMIKTSGYRVSPTEIEEIAFDSKLVAEVVAVGISHPTLGQGILLVAKPLENSQPSSKDLIAAFRGSVPNYMVPLDVQWKYSLPRNSNGKIDRKSIAEEYGAFFNSENENK